jgi:hypothetical protein
MTLLSPLPTLCSDSLQGPTELIILHRPCQVVLADGTADPLDLKTAKGKSEQSQLQVSPG